MKKNEIIQEVLAAMKAMDILDRINVYLKKSGDMIILDNVSICRMANAYVILYTAAVK